MYFVPTPYQAYLGTPRQAGHYTRCLLVGTYIGTYSTVWTADVRTTLEPWKLGAAPLTLQVGV